VPPSDASQEETKAKDSLFSPIEQRSNPFVDAPSSDSILLSKPTKDNISPTDTSSRDDNDSPTTRSDRPEEPVKRSTVKVLRGILKKPRRFSKEVQTYPEEKHELAEPQLFPEDSSGDLSSLPGGIVPEISSKHSDDDNSARVTDESIRSPLGLDDIPRSPLAVQRGSLQLPAFDRMLFAIRGAELRDQYMRGSVMMEKGLL